MLNTNCKVGPHRTYKKEKEKKEKEKEKKEGVLLGILTGFSLTYI